MAAAAQESEAWQVPRPMEPTERERNYALAASTRKASDPAPILRPNSAVYVSDQNPSCNQATGWPNSEACVGRRTRCWARGFFARPAPRTHDGWQMRDRANAVVDAGNEDVAQTRKGGGGTTNLPRGAAPYAGRPGQGMCVGGRAAQHCATLRTGTRGRARGRRRGAGRLRITSSLPTSPP